MTQRLTAYRSDMQANRPEYFSRRIALLWNALPFEM